MIAHILVQKYRWGLPFHRLARMSAAEGFRLDDGTMCRYAEDAGATLGCIVDAMAKEAKDDGLLPVDRRHRRVHPARAARRSATQACRKGHFFVVLADKDHVFFEYQPKHTSAAVCEMFRGFSGYIQADAHAIYDAVFRGEARAARRRHASHGGGLLEPLPTQERGRRPSSRKIRRRARRSCACASSSSSKQNGRTCARAATRATAARLAPARRRLLRLGRRAVRARQGHARPRRHRLRLRRPAGGRPAPLPRRRTTAHDEQPLRARLEGHRRRADGPGCSSAPTTTPAPPPTSSRSSPPASCTGSTPRPTSPRSSTCCPTGRATATSSSPPSTGPPPALASRPPSSPIEIGDITVPPPLPPPEQPATR